MTKIEFFKAVAANEINAEVIAMAEALVAKDAEDKLKQKAKRAEKSANKVADENIAKVLGILTDEPKTGSDLVNGLKELGAVRKDDKELTPQYAATLMRSLIADGKATKTEIKVAGKKAKVVAYTLA